jgi:type IV pilus assembly protein PilP
MEEPRTATITEGGTGICAEPLCNFDLDQLTLVAVVSGDANPVGMLEDPTKVGHLVHRNTRVGKQGGKVTQIQRDCVVVTEYFQSPDGKVNPNRVNLCIKTDKRSAPILDLLQNKIFEAQ